MHNNTERPSLELPPTGILINGTWYENKTTFQVLDKYFNEPIATVSSASRNQVAKAVMIGQQVVEKNLESDPYQRALVLRKTAELLALNKERLITIIKSETGFTEADASGEIDRACVTLNLSADEAIRLVGHMIPFAASPGAYQRIGFTQRFPLGVVCAITPFNSPLNTVLHKVAPAYAAGNAVVLKPSALTPLTSAFLGHLFLEAGMEPAYLSILQGPGETVGSWLLEEPGIAFYAFTGSTSVGRIIQGAIGLRRSQMELGSIASTIICADADLNKAITKVANAAWRKAGQVCTSVQRLYVEKPVYEKTVSELIRHASANKAGNPYELSTTIGPMISETAAIRAEKKIVHAVEAGAHLAAGGQRIGSVISPTVLTNVPKNEPIWCEEAFAPVVSVHPFEDFSAALSDANSTPYGLSAG